MKAMILAAGRGERMRPLSDTTPKPLLEVQNKPLLVWHIEKLAEAGFREIVINVAHLGEQIIKHIGDGSQWGVSVVYSDERQSGALESAGGIKKALPLLGDTPFLVINGDIFCDYHFDPSFALQNSLAHIVLVPNPPHNPEGDFCLKNSFVHNKCEKMLTFSGIGYYNPEIFTQLPDGKAALGPLLRELANAKKLTGTLYKGLWSDIGTPQRLEQINEKMASFT